MTAQQQVIYAVCDYAVMSMPIVFFVLHWGRPRLFRGFARKCFAVALMSGLGWLLVNCTMWVNPPDNGFASFCALLFGWVYIWVFAVPLGLAYFLIRVIVKQVIRLYVIGRARMGGGSRNEQG